MGILDDAIRQHLDLKRQHGVAEEELRRQEEEALGPARRDVAPAPASDGEADVEQEEGATEPVAAEQHAPQVAGTEQDAPEAAATELLDHETELLAEQAALPAEQTALPAEETELPAEETELHDPADLHAEPGDSVPPPEPVPDETFASEPPAAEPVPDEPPASGALPSEPLDADELAEHEEPREEDDPVVEQADPEAEDMLEDTPDFLQETPEHDRLWFEQKPPRDFDFD